MRSTVLFDLGGTLVRYFERSEFPAVLEEAIAEAQEYLHQNRLLRISREDVWQRVRSEDHESENHRVRPLEERLARIFQLGDPTKSSDCVMDMCRRFMKPIFARGRLYENTLPTLRKLRSEGFRMAVVSNTTWGSPADLWREETRRLGLDSKVDAIVFCRDVGWRKPARPIFEFTLKKLGALPQECVFVGDDPRWDIVGPRAVGIKAIVLDRRGKMQNQTEQPIRALGELWHRL